ncbi:hypothetical protein J4455_00775 [Candidatus Woesearchaeota archaeon]|nr:hypothetical protein [Candidatus Woesearchaeota archaeon]
MFKKYIILIILILIISGCEKSADKTPDDSKTSDLTQESYLKGITLTPKSFQGSDFTDFFKKAQELGNIVSWAGDWNELSNTKNGGPTVVASLASQYDYIPIIEAQFFTQSTGKLVRNLDDITKQSYKTSAINFAEKFKPKYLGFGIEINILYEKSPKDFDNFASFYNEVYDEVKKVSPDTKVFTMFQLEKMKGLNGGLFGGSNDPNKAQWQLLDKFSKSDLIAFTSYPNLIYKTPSEIPSNYYTEIKNYVNKPIAFTEIGWHTSQSPVGWESSESEQAEFIKTFFELTKDINKEFVIYSFMFDQNTIEPFNSMGLYNEDGVPRASLNEWMNN